MDQNGNINEWSDVFAILSGFTKAEAIGTPLEDTFLESNILNLNIMLHHNLVQSSVRCIRKIHCFVT